MFKKPRYIALAVVVVVSLLLLNLPRRTSAQLKLALSSLYTVLLSSFRSSQQLAERAGDAVVPRQELVVQLERATRENQELRIQNMRLAEAQRETARLRHMLDMPQPTPWKLKLAWVVARDPANWWRTVKINRGSREGLTTNAPVLTADGLVGRVSEVGYTHSRVVLLGDPDCRVAVVVEGEAGEKGFIAPVSAPLDTSIVDLGYLSLNSRVRPGQRVYTSGVGGVFPKGILIGRIIDMRTVDYGLYGEARVKLEVNLNAMEEVWVIIE